MHEIIATIKTGCGEKSIKRKVNKKMKDKIKRNRAFIENTENNMELIEQSVDKMIDEDVNSKPHNFISVNGANTYPEELHDALELPGKYLGIESPYTYTIDERDKYMDYIEIVDPDDEVIQKSASNVEFQFKKIPDTKKEIIYDYKNTTIIRLQIPTRNFVVTNYQPEELLENYWINEDSLALQYIVFDEERIYKNLNSTKDKYHNMNTLLGCDFMLWVQSIAFLDENSAERFLEESVEFFTTIENVNNSYFRFLHLAHKVMIKNFIKDEKKQRRLLEMITKAIPQTQIESTIGLEKVYLSFKQLKAKNDDLETKYSNVVTKNTNLKAEISNKNAIIKQLQEENAQLKKKNNN